MLSLPLLYVYKKSMESGSVPKDWKKANVTAIFKKGEKSLPCNYRPVSLTSQVCKSLIRNNILEHVRKYNLIRESQHGFVKKVMPTCWNFLNLSRTMWIRVIQLMWCIWIFKRLSIRSRIKD